MYVRVYVLGIEFSQSVLKIEEKALMFKKESQNISSVISALSLPYYYAFYIYIHVHIVYIW